jgi:hypothetical protein
VRAPISHPTISEGVMATRHHPRSNLGHTY